MKVKVTRDINFGIIKDRMVVFKKGELVDFPENGEYAEVFKKALADGFIVQHNPKKDIYATLEEKVKKTISKKPVVPSKKEE